MSNQERVKRAGSQGQKTFWETKEEWKTPAETKHMLSH
jgi:hypothetical protein